MKRENNSGISFFQRYLTIWVVACMGLGVLIGRYLPGIPASLSRFEYARVSIPMALLIWLMIYPMMMKVNFQSVKNVGSNPRGCLSPGSPTGSSSPSPCKESPACFSS